MQRVRFGAPGRQAHGGGAATLFVADPAPATAHRARWSQPLAGRPSRCPR